MKIVVKVGGSILFDDFGVKNCYAKKLIPILEQINKKNQFILSIGGGKFVKNYEKNAKKLLPFSKIQESSIKILQANAVLFSNLLNTKPIFNLNEVNKKTNGVISGICPGRSTDANAAICAEIIGADLFVKLTNIDGVYDKDPNVYKNARHIEKIKFSDLKRILKKKEKNDYKLLDAVAIDTITKNRIKTVIINGEDPMNLKKAISGERIGTVIDG
ncbi:hypothetical protein ACFLQN_03055 [Candidatus Aenigmatarchaeota archaeon]